MSLPEALSSRLRALFGVDERALGLMRIGVGATLLLDLADRSQFLVAHYTQDGVVPRELLVDGDPIGLPLYLANDTAFFWGCIFILAALCATLLILGWKTRFVTVATWILTLSIQARNPLVLFHGDIVLRLVLFFCMFLPWGRRYSLDARQASSPAARDRLVVSGASAALLLQGAFIYLFAATEKYGAAWRGDGSAVFLALSNSHFGGPLGAYLLSYPSLLAVLTFGVVCLQQLSFLLLFFPIGTRVMRGLAVGLLLLMQTGFALTMNLSFFPIVSIIALLPFIPSSWWDACEREFKRV